jgi:hypothetical protein
MACLIPTPELKWSFWTIEICYLVTEINDELQQLHEIVNFFV